MGADVDQRRGFHEELRRDGLLYGARKAHWQQEQDQFSLVVASGKYPDVVEFDWLHSYPGGPAKAIKDGVIIRLNDPIDRYAANFKTVLTQTSGLAQANGHR